MEVFTLSTRQMVNAQSIKKSDIEYFEYRREELNYWLASPGVDFDGFYCYFGSGAVGSGYARADSDLFVSDGNSFESWLGVRPTMVLKSKVQLSLPKFRLNFYFINNKLFKKCRLKLLKSVDYILTIH